MPVPAGVLAYLVVIQPGFALGSLERFLDGPAGSGNRGQLDQGDILGSVADEVGQVRRVLQGAASQQPVLAGDGRSVDADPRPGVEPVPLGAGPGGAGAPGAPVQAANSSSARPSVPSSCPGTEMMARWFMGTAMT